jgi:hypothetical protein
MKLAVIVSVLAVAGADLPAQAGTQVVAGDGITLTEAARIKFNRDAGSDDQQVAVERVAPSGDYTQLAASFGMDAGEAQSLTLAEIFVAKINHGEGASDQQLVKGSGVGMATRSPAVTPDRTQLAASAGIEPGAAAGMSLGAIAAVKFERGGAND